MNQLIELNKYIKNDEVRSIFVRNNQKPEFYDKLSEIGCDYLYNYYETISNIFHLKQRVNQLYDQED